MEDSAVQRSPLLQHTVSCSGFSDGQPSPKTLVTYLGSVKILRPLDLEMCGSVVEIYDNSRTKRKRRTLPTFELDFCNEALCLRPENEGQTLEFKLNRITCCGVDSKKRKILVLNYHDTSGQHDGLPYRTHALLCNSERTAKITAIRVGEFFKARHKLRYN
jgi:hypothetical protein